MTAPAQDANDLLMGSGSPTAKFPTLGTLITGTVLKEPEARQQKDYRTQALETWKDGSPKMMVVVQLGTNERDPEKFDDDGTRTLYIQGRELTNAVRQAVRASGANGIHTGGVLNVQYVGDGELDAAAIKANMTPPKLYAAHYQPPAVSFNGVTGPVQQQQFMPQPVQQQIPVQQYAQQAAPVQQQFMPQQPVQQAAPVQQQFMPQPVQQAASPLPAGVTAEMWARLDESQRAAVIAAAEQPAWATQPAA